MSPMTIALGASLALVLAAPVAADPFVFRGQIDDGTQSAEGRYALRLTLYAGENSAAPIAGPLELLAVPVSDGRFAVEVDFGALPPLGRGWLEVSAKGEADADYIALGGRMAVGLDAAAACPAAWTLDGNASTNPAVNFLGTIDAQPFEIRVNGERALRIEPALTSVNVIAGDDTNSIVTGEKNMTIAGGEGNRTYDGGAAIGGGRFNSAGAEDPVFDGHATVAGGFGNDAIGSGSVIGGGTNNRATGAHSVVPGGLGNCAGGANSFAGGRAAKVRPATAGAEQCAGLGSYPGGNGDEGTFVWADSSTAEAFVSTGSNQFNIRAAGGMRLSDGTGQHFGSATRQMLNLYAETYGIGVQNSTLYLRSNGGFAWFEGGTHADSTNDPGGGVLQMRLDGNGNLFTAGAVNPSSDRNLKTAFAPIEPLDVLARVLELPLSEWSYRASPTQRHLGPMAQDFRAAFGLGGDDRSIATVDADGVALAAIQGLNEKLEAENAALQDRLRRLEARLDALATRMEREPR